MKVMSINKFKILVLFTNLGPYHQARLRAFNELINNTGNLTGLEITRDGVDYQWNTTVQNLNFPVTSILEGKLPSQVNVLVQVQKTFATLTRLNPDVLVIAGYGQVIMNTALLWAIFYGKVRILFSDTKEDDSPRSRITETVKSFLVKQYQAALVAGNCHKNYLIKLGMPEAAIFTGYDVVDNAVFHPSKIRTLPPPLNIPYFLAINRFVPKKNLSRLLSAYADYHRKSKNPWHLVLCGDGEQRASLERLIQDHQLQDYIHLPGFLQQTELLPFFAQAKCFIHASTTEQWGLVVNEAMAAGLPVIVSNRCGCFEDLVQDGINGHGFNPEDPTELTALMLKMSSGDVDLDTMGQASLEHIQNYSPDTFAQGLKQAIDYSLNTSKKK